METNYCSLDPVLFNEKKVSDTYIKVIGTGGGGGNAVNRMYKQGIDNVTFAIFNTDVQDLAKSPIPVKVQLGESSTHGLGAGGRPEVGKQAAEEDLEKINAVLSDNTRMVFITAGMGGGTGTGSAPVIARCAKEKNILTVGVVTIPFEFEGKRKFEKAKAGLEEIRQHVDALLVIDNRQLVKVYPDLELDKAFAMADDILCNATKSIADIINTTGYINVDFADVNTIMRDGGVAIMSTGKAEGENRVTEALRTALTSPLLHDNDVRGAKRLLMYMHISPSHPLTSGETKEIQNFVDGISKDIELIWGAYYNEDMKESICFTVIATGFEIKSIINDDNDSAPSSALSWLEQDSKTATHSAEEKEDAPTNVHEANKKEYADNPDEEGGVDTISWAEWVNDAEDDEDSINIPPSMRGK